MTTQNARCACGQLTVTVAWPPFAHQRCDCAECRRRTGSSASLLAGFNGPHAVEGEAVEYRRETPIGVNVTSGFCPLCGTTVYTTRDGHEEEHIVIEAGCLTSDVTGAPAAVICATTMALMHNMKNPA